MSISSVSAGNVPAAAPAAGEAPTAVKSTDQAQPAAAAVVSEKAGEEPAVKVEIGQAQTPVNDAQKAGAAKLETKLDENLFQSVLKELDTAIEQRSVAIKSLPPDIQEATKEILSKTLADSATISEGMIATIKAEKSVVEQLQSFANLLADAQQISRQAPQDMLKSLADMLQNFEADLNDMLQKAGTSAQQDGTQTALSEEQNMLANKTPVEGKALPETGGNTQNSSEAKGAAEEGARQQTLQREEAAPSRADSTTELRTNNKQNAENLQGKEKPLTAEEVPGKTVELSKSEQQAVKNKVNEKALPESGDKTPKQAANKTAIDTQQSDTDTAPLKPGNSQLAREEAPKKLGAETQPQVRNGQTGTQAKGAQQSAVKSEIPTKPGAGNTPDGGITKYQYRQDDGSKSNTQAPKSAAWQTAASLEKESLENSIINIAKQLVGNNSRQQDNVKNAVREFLRPVLQETNSPEAAVLKKMVEAFSQNAPEILKFAAGKHNLPQLPQLWAMVKMNKALEWANLDQEKLQESIRTMREITASMKKSAAFSGEKIDNNSSLSFSMPLYLGEGMQPYPAYIHLYHQRQKGGKENGGEYMYETWLRICLATENIGPVDIVFRLYQENLLNVKVAFSKDTATQSFTSYLPDIREALDESALNLVEVSVNTKPDLGG